MECFDVKERFYLNARPFKILSGAIHYFRIHPDDWVHSLYNLKALGFNTVETYVPWNLHEPHEGEFDFEGGLDIEKFLTTAHELGLYAIVRPSPYICAEWEWGGLPAWLLEKNVRVRSRDQVYLYLVNQYYKELLPRLAKHQLSQGGNILMFQVENEFGSYGEDKVYLNQLSQMMRQFGLTQPFFTSDGPWHTALEAGSLIDEDILVTGNFGSRASENFECLQSFMDKHNKKWPLMCMEFWDGWFNRWGEEVIRRDPEELADSVMEALERGSINLYMFHGGTNFGFMNGSSARDQKDLPQVTSYDYDAILDEAGNPTAKFFALQKRLKEVYPELSFAEPLVKPSMAITDVPLSEKRNLSSILNKLSSSTDSFYPQNMESLGQNTGYIYYRHLENSDRDRTEKLRLIDARDRAQVFLNGQKIATQYQEEIGGDIELNLVEGKNQLDILVENMARVNYGHKFTAPTQHKGLGRGAIIDLHFVGKWETFTLPLDYMSELPCSDEAWVQGPPSFYQFDFNVDNPEDSYLDMSGFGKGVVFVNGFNIGRYWHRGPIHTLYIPHGLFNTGENRIIVFETEGIYQDTINFVKKSIIDEKGENS
ncbi:glycoside hydrolase family 35 protein [Streptococcus hongkongensis]|nr:beta-galactosidase [Streptococcus uberis]